MPTKRKRTKAAEPPLYDALTQDEMAMLTLIFLGMPSAIMALAAAKAAQEHNLDLETAQRVIGSIFKKLLGDPLDGRRAGKAGGR